MDTGDNTTSLLLVQTLYDSRGKNHGFFPFKSLIYLFAVSLDASPPRVNPKLIGTKNVSHLFWNHQKSLLWNSFAAAYFVLTARCFQERKAEDPHAQCEYLLFLISTSSWQQRTKSVAHGLTPPLLLTSPASSSPLAAFMCSWVEYIFFMQIIYLRRCVTYYSD